MKKMILCASCHRPLWAIRLIAGGHPVEIPASPQVPVFRIEDENCPLCHQSIYLEDIKGKKFFVRDEEQGRLRLEAVA